MFEIHGGYGTRFTSSTLESKVLEKGRDTGRPKAAYSRYLRAKLQRKK